jgi:hypothetical protein
MPHFLCEQLDPLCIVLLFFRINLEENPLATQDIDYLENAFGIIEYVNIRMTENFVFHSSQSMQSG